MALAIQTKPTPLKMDADGVVRVGNTRVTLDTIVIAFEEGLTPEEIAFQYPVLDLADIYDALGYYLRERTEVQAYLQERSKRAEQVRRISEQRFDPNGIRSRLLARSSSIKVT